MARSSIPKTNKYIISIKPSHWQLNLKERFWVIGVNISYLNYFGWSFQGKINSFAVFTRYNSMFFINGYGPVLDIELGSMFRMSQTIHYNALVWKKNVLVWIFNVPICTQSLSVLKKKSCEALIMNIKCTKLDICNCMIQNRSKDIEKTYVNI